jgi:hypothetical protein
MHKTQRWNGAFQLLFGKSSRFAALGSGKAAPGADNGELFFLWRPLKPEVSFGAGAIPTGRAARQ